MVRDRLPVLPRLPICPDSNFDCLSPLFEPLAFETNDTQKNMRGDSMLMLWRDPIKLPRYPVDPGPHDLLPEKPSLN